jgi:serine/threonine protein kinase
VATAAVERDDELAAVREALRGQYQVERELGRGGMGVVYLALDGGRDRRVAVKILPPAPRRRPPPSDAPASIIIPG